MCLDLIASLYFLDHLARHRKLASRPNGSIAITDLLTPLPYGPSQIRKDHPETVMSLLLDATGTFPCKISKHTLRISLFLTLQICWMSAALCETFSSELPVNCNSSFWFLDASTSTPSCIVTFRTIFSPRKLLHPYQSLLALNASRVRGTPHLRTYRISTSKRPVSGFFSRLTLMGKWA